MKEISSPKRRKSKDNPYVMNIIDNNTYIIVFKANSKEEKVQVSKDVYDAFNQFELEDIRQLHEYERHIEHSEQTDINLYKRATIQNSSLEELVDNNILQEKLKLAIDKLSEIQKRRLIKYYFEGKNEYEIAKEEGTTQQAINKSLKQSIEKLKEILKI